MELLPSYALGEVSPRRSSSPGKFATWLTEQVTRRGRHLVLREAQAVLGPTGRGFSKSVLSRKEAGELPTALQLFALSRVLKVPADAMLALIAADYGMAAASGAAPQVISEHGERLARWFDGLKPARRAALLATLDIPEVDNGEAAPARKDRGDQAKTLGRRR